MPRNLGPYGAASGTQNPVAQLFKPKQTRQHFSPADDERIVDAVGDHPYPNWNEIAELVPGKTGRQCRERFQHYLSPNLMQAPWSPDEDDLVRRLYAECGPDWARIAQHFGGRRTNYNIKNRWNNHLSAGRGHAPPARPPDRPARAPPHGACDALSDAAWTDAAADPHFDWFGDPGLPDEWPL
jgi:hypothetical protein